MCGFFITNIQLDKDLLNFHADKRLKFRGPDYNSGLVKHGKWLAIHYRLSIIGLSEEGVQPVLGEGNEMLVYNGEILNFKELGLKYFNKVYTSDTRLLWDLIRSERLDLNELDGFFSFVYINAGGDLKIAARDKFGVKPLYYLKINEGVAFSSEPKLLSDIFKKDITFEALNEYRIFRYPIFKGSYFEHIKQVESGHCLINGMYFDVLNELKKKTTTSLPQTLQTLAKSVETRLVSDAQVGLLLSGGVDSNIIRNLAPQLKCYAVGIGDDDPDLKRIRDLKIEGVSYLNVTPEEFKKDFNYLVDLRGEPLSVPNEVLLYAVAKKAREDGIKVLLSGEGADEFYGGYDRLYRWSKYNEFDLKEFLNLYCYDEMDEEGEEFKKIGLLFESLGDISCHLKVKYFLIKYHLPILFRRLDFGLMAAGVEGREPLASIHNFIDSCGYDIDDLVNEKNGKIPLRNALKKWMNPEFADLKKIGFPVDLKTIFQENRDINNYEIWFEQNLKELAK